MKSILSVLINSDRVYVGRLELADTGVYLTYINSTDKRLDLMAAEDEDSWTAASELETIIADCKDDYDEIKITLPSEVAIIRQIPGAIDTKREDLKSLVNLEIRQSFPNASPDSFAVRIAPMSPRVDGKSLFLAEIIDKKAYSSIRGFLQNAKKALSGFEIAQINAHHSFIYNYPEYAEGSAMFFGVQDSFIDVSMVKNGLPLYYNLLSINSGQSLADVSAAEVDKALNECSPFIDSVFFFGSGLTQSAFSDAKNKLLGSVQTISRLNGLRMTGAKLSDREKQYCSKTAHIIAPLIGAAFNPNYQVVEFE